MRPFLMPYTAAAWQNVAHAITQRMGALGVSQADLARQSGVSDFTIRKLIRADQTSYRAAVLQKVARALGWSSDGIDRLLAGEQPELMATQRVVDAGDQLAALQAQVAFQAEGMAALVDEMAALQAQVKQLGVEVVKAVRRSRGAGE